MDAENSESRKMRMKKDPGRYSTSTGLIPELPIRRVVCEIDVLAGIHWFDVTRERAPRTKQDTRWVCDGKKLFPLLSIPRKAGTDEMAKKIVPLNVVDGKTVSEL